MTMVVDKFKSVVDVKDSLRSHVKPELLDYIDAWLEHILSTAQAHCNTTDYEFNGFYSYELKKSETISEHVELMEVELDWVKAND